MRRAVLLAILAGLAGLCGCATMTHTPQEVKATYDQIMEYSARQIADDWNYIIMMDRPSRLSRWVMR